MDTELSYFYYLLGLIFVPIGMAIEVLKRVYPIVSLWLKLLMLQILVTALLSLIAGLPEFLRGFLAFAIGIILFVIGMAAAYPIIGAIEHQITRDRT